MNALDELKTKQKKTPLEFTILICEEMGGEATAADAAAELAAKDAALEAANGRLARMYDNASILRLMDEVEIRHGVDEDRWGILRRMIGEE